MKRGVCAQAPTALAQDEAEAPVRDCSSSTDVELMLIGPGRDVALRAPQP